MLALVSVVLGYIGLARYVNALPDSSTYASATPLDVLYYSLQLFVLAAEPLDSTGTYPVTLEVARLLAPFTTILALVEGLIAMLRDRVVAFRTASLSGHTIVTGATSEARILAARLADTGAAVVWISPDPTEKPATRSVRFVPGSPNSLGVLKAAGAGQASVVYACAASDSDNFATAVHIRGLNQNSVQVLAEVRNEGLVSAFRVRRMPKASLGYRLDFFAMESIAAQELLRRFPPKSDRITIVGFDWFGKSVLRHILRRTPGYRLTPAITVVTSDPDEVDRFVAQLGGPPDGVVVDPKVTPSAEPGLVYLCLDSDDEVLRLGLGPEYVNANRVVLCLQQENAVAEVFEAQLFDRSQDRIEIFPALERACNPDLIGLDIIETMAHALHENYVASHAPEGDPMAVHWDELSDEGKKLNYSQAEHIGVILNNEGMEVVQLEAAEHPFQFLDDEVDHLAEKEHERWMAQKTDQQVSWGKEKTESTNPNMVPWHVLKEDVQESNRRMISFIPTLLADHGLGIRRFSDLETDGRSTPHPGPSMLTDQQLLQIARMLHDRYLALYGLEGGPSAVAWEELPEETRDSNLSHAAHIETKLRAIGAEVVEGEAADQQFEFSKAELEELAVMEHERWMTNRSAHGYVRADPRTELTHPDLVPWDDLSNDARQKDIDFVLFIPAVLRSCGLGIRRNSG